jgi:hypothetical protein
MTDKHTFKQGDILVSTWGYSMRLVDFYHVDRVTAHSVCFRRMEATVCAGTGRSQGTKIPDLSFGAIPRQMGYMRRAKLCQGIWLIKNHNDSGCARLWDGKPVTFDHND